MNRGFRLRASMGLVLGSFAVLAGACVPDGRDDGGPSVGGGPNGFGGSGSVPSPAPPPDPSLEPLPPTVTAAVAPPPISGGTLLVLKDGKTAVASDPERDAVFVVDLVSERLLARIALEAGDEPGRLAEDGSGSVLVILRRGGGVVAINPFTGTLDKRVPVCPAPRGIAVDTKVGAPGTAHVACAGGELVSLETGSLTELRRVRLERDLRDVVVSGSHLFVSRFRAAEVLVLASADLSVIERRQAPGSAIANRPLSESRSRGPSTGGEPPPAGLRSSEPGVAWRMRALRGGGAIMLHQESSNAELGLEEGGYGGGPCRGPMGAAVAEFHEGATGAVTSTQLMSTLPVDFDLSADGKSVALLNLGGGSVRFGRTQVSLMPREMLYQDNGGCVPPPPPPIDEPIAFRPPTGEPIAVAFDTTGRLVVQTREPARIEIVTHKGGSIKLADDSRADTGHKIFHMATGLGMACASCHPEGGDDGRAWRFAKIGTRRTQSLRGGIAMTAPFHWDGLMRDMTHLMNEVFTARMRGPKLDAGQVGALAGWVERIPVLTPSAPADAEALNRGQVLFNDVKVGCASCHKGSLFTDNTSRIVGTGATLQVPSLRGIGFRAPYMHNGCAKTLMDRFDGTCGGGDKHGITSQLDRAQLQDLVTYLESL